LSFSRHHWKHQRKTLSTKKKPGQSEKHIVIGEDFGEQQQVEIRRWIVSTLATF
jgi:hypothetical protein